MTDVIDALRTIRHSGKFEPCLSTLTVAIGDVERLTDLDEAQIERLRSAVTRLTAAYYKHALVAAAYYKHSLGQADD